MKKVVFLTLVFILCVIVFSGCAKRLTPEEQAANLLEKNEANAIGYVVKSTIDAKVVTSANGYEIWGNDQPQETLYYMSQTETSNAKYLVCLANGTIWRNIGKGKYPGDSGKTTSDIYVEIYPVNACNQIIKECNQYRTLELDKLNSLDADLYNITGTIKGRDGDGLIIYGCALPVSGGMNSPGAHYSNCNILVQDPDNANNRSNIMYINGVHAYLGTTVGTNAYGGAVTVYVYGEPKGTAECEDKIAYYGAIINAVTSFRIS